MQRVSSLAAHGAANYASRLTNSSAAAVARHKRLRIGQKALGRGTNFVEGHLRARGVPLDGSANTNRFDRQMTAPVAQRVPSPGHRRKGAGSEADPRRSQTAGSDSISLARSVLEPILGPFESALIISIVAVFILLQREDLRDRLIRLFGSAICTARRWRWDDTRPSS